MASPPPPPPVVALGTASELKVKAVETWLASVVGVDATVRALSFPSGVAEQPVGPEETREGAAYRCRRALDRVPQAAFAVGIESGMMLREEGALVVMGAMPTGPPAGDEAAVDGEPETDPTPSDWIDAAAIVLSSHAGEEALVWSEALPIPAACMARCSSGDAVGGDMTWSESKDPHVLVTRGRTRREFLEAALRQAAAVDFARTALGPAGARK